MVQEETDRLRGMQRRLSRGLRCRAFLAWRRAAAEKAALCLHVDQVAQKPRCFTEALIGSFEP